MAPAVLIEGLLDGYERRRRMESFGRAFRGAAPAYWDGFREWDVTTGAMASELRRGWLCGPNLAFA